MTTALLVMDMQNGIVERFAGEGSALIDNVSSAIAAARSHGTEVIFVRVAFRPGSPEVSPRNKSFSALAGSDAFSEDGPATQIHPSVAPAEGEVVCTKRRVGAFSGSDLEVVLRSKGITSLVLMGIATSGVVLSTTRQAADMDYALTILHDACADSDEEVHHVLMNKVFPRQATVCSTQEWTSSFASQSPDH
jgi:nicotinamidase-related amidase